jgi:hypothetical protein
MTTRLSISRSKERAGRFYEESNLLRGLGRLAVASFSKTSFRRTMLHTKNGATKCNDEEKERCVVLLMMNLGDDILFNQMIFFFLGGGVHIVIDQNGKQQEKAVWNSIPSVWGNAIVSPFDKYTIVLSTHREKHHGRLLRHSRQSTKRLYKSESHGKVLCYTMTL